MSENSESTERYIDPNSGAAPQPGGFVAGSIPEQAQAKESATDAGQDGADPTEEATPRAVETEPETEPETEDEGEGEDYSELLSQGVDKVNEYIEQNPDERDAVIEAERAGKNRKGITES